MSYRLNEVDKEYHNKKKEKNNSNVKNPKVYKTKVNISKVNFPVVKEWITDKLNEHVPDDEIIIDYVCELLQGEENPDIEAIQFQMQDFLGKEESLKFCEELWILLISANQDPDGIPSELLERRKIKLAEIDMKEKKRRNPPTLNKKTNYNRSQYNSSKRDIDPVDQNRSERNYRTNRSSDNSRDYYSKKKYDNRSS